MMLTKKHRGFTLIELLVVVLIISIMIGIISVMINRSSRGGDVRSEVNILKARLLYAEQVALTTAQPIVFSVSKKDYQFYILNTQDQWQTFNQNNSLSHHEWTQHFDLTLQLPNLSSSFVPDTLPNTPMIIFNPAGGVTPFTLTINGFTLIGKYNGNITLE
jgi:type II secretion system protein H